jgi:hypothetical protein
MTCQTHCGSKWQPHCLLPHIWAAGSVAPCFDLPLSQRTVRSPSPVLGYVEAVKSLQHSFIIQQNIHLLSVPVTLQPPPMYCLQSQFPSHQSANSTVHCNAMNVTIQLCQYQGREVKYCSVWSQFSLDVLIFKTCCSKSCLALLSMTVPSLVKFMGCNFISITSTPKQSMHLSILAILSMLLNFMLPGTHGTFCCSQTHCLA